MSQKTLEEKFQSVETRLKNRQLEFVDFRKVISKNAEKIARRSTFTKLVEQPRLIDKSAKIW